MSRYRSGIRFSTIYFYLIMKFSAKLHLSIFIIFIYLIYSLFFINIFNYHPLKKLNSLTNIWPGFKVNKKSSSIHNCLKNTITSIENLIDDLLNMKELKHNLCKNFYENFNLLYEIRSAYTRKMELPKYINNKEDYKPSYFLNNQRIIHIFNRFTNEQNAYNPLRATRPSPIENKSFAQYLDEIDLKTKNKCDFCHYMNRTAADELGRNENEYTVRITNIFKINDWHSMVISRHHHPLNLSATVIEKMLEDGTRWCDEVYDINSSYIYPNLGWDTLYKAGASQIHPHIHLIATPNHYLGAMEQLRSSAHHFFEKTGQNYFSHLVDIYADLGLAVFFGDAVALSLLSGKGDSEVMILSDQPNSDLYRLLYFVIQAYTKHLKEYCFSASMVWPALGSSLRSQQKRVPAMIRIISRGNCQSLQNDKSNLELFLITYRSNDPYDVVKAIKLSIDDDASNTNINLRF